MWDRFREYFIKKLLSPFKISLYCLVVFLVLYVSINSVGNIRRSDFLTNWDKDITDIFFRLRPPQKTSGQVGLVTVDAKSIKEIGRWPWSRNYMIQLIKTLNDYYHVKVIGFDIVFSEADQTFVNLKTTLEPIPSSMINSSVRSLVLKQKDYDTQFADTINQYNNIVLGYFFRNDLAFSAITKDQLESYTQAIAPMKIGVVSNLGNHGNTSAIHVGEYPEVNIFTSQLNEKYKAGFFSVTPDENDGVVRRVESVYSYKGGFYPSLPIQIFYTSRQLQDLSLGMSVAFDGTGMRYFTVGDDLFPTDVDGTFRINFLGPVETIPHYSFYDVLNKKIPQADLQGKLLIVGVTELGVYDIRSTPVGSTYPGLEVQGTILDNLIQHNFLQENFLSQGLSMLLILVGCLGVGLVKKYLNNLFGDFGVIVLIVALLANNFWWMNTQHLVVSASFPLSAMVMAWFFGLLHTIFAEGKDKRFIKGAFGQYLAPKVIDQLITDPSQLKLGGQRRQLTIMFTDLQGFSTISEKLDVGQLTAVLNEYLSKMVDIIMAHEGTVDKFEGDAIIAFWGAPLPSEKHALEACSALIDMQKAMVPFRESLQARNLPLLKMRVGLNTGEVMVGNFGSSQRMDYTVIGDSANLAARLEGVNKMYGTFSIISEKTLSQLGDKFTVRMLDEIQVVGKEEPIKIFELQSFSNETTPQQVKKNQAYAHAYGLYRAQKFAEAKVAFQTMLQEFPDDGPASIFVDRVQELIDNPPAEGWTGINRLTSK